MQEELLQVEQGLLLGAGLSLVCCLCCFRLNLLDYSQSLILLIDALRFSYLLVAEIAYSIQTNLVSGTDPFQK